MPSKSAKSGPDPVTDAVEETVIPDTADVPDANDEPALPDDAAHDGDAGADPEPNDGPADEPADEPAPEPAARPKRKPRASGADGAGGAAVVAGTKTPGRGDTGPATRVFDLVVAKPLLRLGDGAVIKGAHLGRLTLVEGVELVPFLEAAKQGRIAARVVGKKENPAAYTPVEFLSRVRMPVRHGPDVPAGEAVAVLESASPHATVPYLLDGLRYGGLTVR